MVGIIVIDRWFHTRGVVGVILVVAVHQIGGIWEGL